MKSFFLSIFLALGSFFGFHIQQAPLATSTIANVIPVQSEQINARASTSPTYQPVNSTPVNIEQSQTNVQSTSAGISTISIPSLPPFMNWTIATSSSIWSQKVVFASSTFANYSPPLNIFLNTSPLNMKTQDPTVPLETWTSVVSNQDASSDQFYKNFYNYYDSILTKEGWSYGQMNLPNATIDGVAAGGVTGQWWSYLKINGGNLYMIVLGYSGTIYEVDVSDPIPLKQLGL
jgi:hypothetical protein